MRKTLATGFAALMFLAGALAAAPPDVKKEIKTEFDFGGSLGRVMRFFGAGKPIYNVEYYTADKKRVDTVNKKGKPTQTTIYDLARGVIINIDWKDKSYTEMTFDEWKEFIQTGFASLFNPENSDMQEPGGQTRSDDQETEVKLKFDVSSEKTGKKKTVADQYAEEVILKLKVEAEAEGEDRETGEKVKGRGGLNVISHNWIAKSASGPEKEIRAVHMKIAERLGVLPAAENLGEMMSKLMQSNEQLAKSMERLAEEGKNFDGPIVENVSIYETWGESDQMNKEQSREKPQASKALGGFMKKFGGGKSKTDDNKNRLLTTKMTVQGYDASALPDDIFRVYENKKLKKKKVELPSQQ